MKRSIVAVLTVLVLLGGDVWGQTVDSRQTDQKYAALMGLIEQYYLDTVKLPELTEVAIRAVLKELDPHSVYISKEDVDKMNEPLVGSFEGIGITYHIYRDTLMVVSAIPGGPSEKLGIMAGDRIVSINGEVAVGKVLTQSFVFSKLRGKKGSEVLLRIVRPGTQNLLEFTIVRDKIPLTTVVATFMLDSVTGYIRLSRFASPSPSEMKTALRELLANGMTCLVFDLRGNSGGYMNAAIEIADEFLPEDKLIVYTRGNRSPRLDYTAKGKGLFEQGRLLVLMDDGSASASEIVAGALQDWDRALLAGRRSYGKGLVQKPYYLTDGSQVRLTTARYYTPSGRCIQRPYDAGKDDYFKEVSRRIKHGEWVHADSIQFPDSLRYLTPAGRAVYGGGGIMPDVFIPVDTSFTSGTYDTLVRKGILSDFALEYVDKNRAALLASFHTEPAFLAKFSVDSVLLREFVAYTGLKGMNMDSVGVAISSTFLKGQLTALIARNLFSLSLYHQVMSSIDPVILKTLIIMHDPRMFGKLSQK